MYFPFIVEQALMAVTEPLSIVDPAYRIVWANRARAELHGRSVDEMIQEFCYEMFQGKTAPCDGCPVTETLGTGKPCIRERSIKRADGSRVWTETHAWPVFDDGGGMAYVVEYARNITERKESEGRMREMHAFQQGVIDGLAEPVMVIGADYRVRLMNRAACEFSFADAIAEPLFCYAVSHNSGMPCGGDAHPCPLEQVRKSGQPVTVVHEHHQSTGEKRIVEIVASPLWGAAGDFQGIIECARDITDRCRHEHELETLHLKTERQLERITALRSIDMAISASLDLRVTLDVFLDQVTSQLRVDAAAVLLYNANTQSLEYASDRGFRTNAIRRSHLQLGEGRAGRAALERRIIGIPDIAAEGEAFRPLEEGGEEFRSYYAAPLIAKGHVKGVLEIFHRDRLNPDGEWMDFLEALALQASIAIENAALFDNLYRSNSELNLAYNSTLEGWARALDMRDKVTEGHSQRVARVTTYIAKTMGISEDELAHVYRGALLHDIGKLCVPDSILFKEGPLSDEEWEIMRSHPLKAYALMSTIPFLRPARDIPYCHHERWNGTGYPNKLRGEEIPLPARIFAVVDVWDALRSDRPYRSSWPETKVRDYIVSLASAHFDPDVVRMFIDLEIDDTCL